MSGQVRDMTKGSPGRLIILFAIPLNVGKHLPAALYYGRYYCCRTDCRSSGSGCFGRG